MAASITEAPFLTNIGFLITYRCQIACPHCVVHAGPHRGEEMALEDTTNWIRQASAYAGGHIKAACFTGGEPFYDLPKLKRLCGFAVAHGMVPTVVSNAFWADTEDHAMNALESLPLQVISISADAHHQSQIPFANVRNALLAAKRLDLIYNVAVCTEDESDPAHQDFIRRLEQIVERDRISTVVTFAAGRALQNARSLRYATDTTPPATACPGAGTPTIFPDGRVYACIGPVIDIGAAHPLLLGNAKTTPLAEMLDAAEIDPVLHILRLWGPARLLTLLEERGHGPLLPKLFVRNSMCNLCHSLMSDLRLCAALSELANDQALVEKIAYGRMYYLHETRMLEKLGLQSAATYPGS